MKEPEFSDVTSELTAHKGAADTSKVLLMDQVEAALEEVGSSGNKVAIESVLGELPLLSEAASGSTSKYATQVAEKQQELKKRKADATPSASLATSDAGGRQDKIKKIAEAEAQQIKMEVRLKEAKAAAKQQDVMREAVGEHLRLEYGKKQKPAPESLKNRLAKACRCSRSLAEARRKDTCDLNPTRLRYLMRQNVEERACITKQLASNTTLSKAQQAAALEHIFGSDVFVAGPPPAACHPREFWPQIFFQVRLLLWGACELLCEWACVGM
jgi:hypothetical protein